MRTVFRTSNQENFYDWNIFRDEKTQWIMSHIPLEAANKEGFRAAILNAA